MNTSFKKKMGITAVALAAVVGLSTVGTLALFTDSDAVAGNAFDTGEIDLATTPTSAIVSYVEMMPGDSVTDDVVVTNSNSTATQEALRYSVKAAATNADGKLLRNQLVLTVKTIDVTTPGTPCDNFDGADTLYSNDLDEDATYDGSDAALTYGEIIGDPASGQNGVAASGGDRVLAASGSETLCFRVSLPIETGNSFESAASTATFTFDAEQTKNN